ncbi:MAG: hypothetical protein ACRD0G_08655 [Acidimicrobiales bacterium]
MSPTEVDERDEREEEPPSQPADRRRWWLIGGVVVAVVVAAVIGFAVLGGDDDGDDASDPASGAPPSLPPPVEAQLDAEGQELVDLLESGRDGTYHATYVATVDAAGAEQTLELWRRDGLLRQDTRQVSDAGTVETAGFLLEDGETIACDRVNEGDWTCARQVSPQSADGVFGTITSQLEGADVTVTEEEVAGRPARCFAVPAPDGEVSQCVSADGIPLRLRGPGVELLLTDLSEDVPDDIFTPPAEPVEGAGDS